MQTQPLPTWAKAAGLLFGAGLLFIGARFLYCPEVAERGYGLVYNQPNNAFHTVKGIRDLFSGLLLLSFSWLGWRKPLAVVMLVGSIIPVVDLIVVLRTPQALRGAEWIHGSTALALWVVAFFLLRSSLTKKTH